MTWYMNIISWVSWWSKLSKEIEKKWLTRNVDLCYYSRRCAWLLLVSKFDAVKNKKLLSLSILSITCVSKTVSLYGVFSKRCSDLSCLLCMICLHRRLWMSGDVFLFFLRFFSLFCWKKEKDTWQNKRFCDTFFFACGALKQGGTSKLVFEIKGKGKKKSQRAKIFGKENKRRTKNERGSVWSDA